MLRYVGDSDLNYSVIILQVPVCKMGQLALYDWLHGHLSNEEFDLFSYDDIDAVYERVEQLKYNQTVSKFLRGNF